MKIEWDPPRTPHNLLQEQYYPDRWKMAVICMFLNCTQRKTAEPIVHKFFARYPTPEHYIWAYEWEARSDIIDLISPLGFGNRRAERIFKFSLDYLAGGWSHLKECHGIGDYADACDRMFFEKDFDETPPEDGVLANVWRWIMQEKRDGSQKKETLDIQCTCQKCLKRKQSTFHRTIYTKSYMGPGGDSFCYASCDMETCRPISVTVCAECAAKMEKKNESEAMSRQIGRKNHRYGPAREGRRR